MHSGNARNSEVPILFKIKKTTNAENTPMVSLKLLKILVIIKLG